MYAMSARELNDASRALALAPMNLARVDPSALALAPSSSAMTPWRGDPARRGGHSVVDSLIDVVEVDGGLFAWGFTAGRFGVVTIPGIGVSIDMLVGLLLGALGMFEVGGSKLAPHFMNLGIASLGSFAMRKGVQLGTSMRTSAGLPALGASDLASGIFGGDFARQAISSGAARDLTDAELAAMAAATRHA
jgi:hypothetical protein